jgi:hypothetical protein
MGATVLEGAIMATLEILPHETAPATPAINANEDGVTLAEACRIFEEREFNTDSLPRGFHFCSEHVAVELDGSCKEATEQGQDDHIPGRLLWVGAYDADRMFGGPEEGGWWYEYGLLITDGRLYAQIGQLPSVHKYLSDAIRARNAMQLALDPLNQGKPDIDSVCCPGRCRAEIHEGSLPFEYPAQRPSWE